MIAAVAPTAGRVPVEAFPVVVATGIVAVAAVDAGHPAAALVLEAIAGGGLAGTVLVVLVRIAARRSATARRPVGITDTCGLFGFVAATDVVATQLDRTGTWRPSWCSSARPARRGSRYWAGWCSSSARSGPGRCAPGPAGAGCSPWSPPSRSSPSRSGWPPATPVRAAVVGGSAVL